MHSYHLNLFLSGTMLGASLPLSGIGAMGVLLAVINFATYIREVQKYGDQHPC